VIVVSNSTPLIHLAAMNRLELLRDLFAEVHVPEAVYEEVVVLGAGKPGATEIASATWIVRHGIANRLAYSVLRTSLGAGEAACIVLAAETGAGLLILDDRAARQQAQAQGLTVAGSVGVLLAADQQGLLDFKQALDELLATGFRLRPSEYQRVVDLWMAGRGSTP